MDRKSVWSWANKRVAVDETRGVSRSAVCGLMKAPDAMLDKL